MCSLIIGARSESRNPTPTFAQMIASARAAGLITAHLISPDCAVVPSATARDTEYILVRVNGAWACNCPAPGRCWHQDRAAQLAAVAQPAPVAVAPAVDKAARYAAALEDVFGIQAA